MQNIMADNRKLSAPSTSKQVEPEERYVYDVEGYVKRKFTETGIIQGSTNEDKYVLLGNSFK